MAVVSKGFRGRGGHDDRLPPGQYVTPGFPVLSAGPTPQVETADWTFTLTTEDGRERAWTWDELLDLPQSAPHTDIHCVTGWTKYDTDWQGVSIDVLLDDVDTEAEYAEAYCHGGYTTNLPLADLTGGKAWIAHTFDGDPLPAEHGGPARLLVPHLYFWKSAKWVKGLRLLTEDRPGFWERAGYHNHGDPWREQRYWNS
ncbi:MAG: sulfite oxidase-like oxidoreductase [Nonomuraea sp.]|nr:sulfite oxidase-like oxidoreductase [Nonomuraea sp.]